MLEVHSIFLNKSFLLYILQNKGIFLPMLISHTLNMATRICGLLKIVFFTMLFTKNIERRRL